MDRFEEIKAEYEWVKTNLDEIDEDMEYLLSEVERLRTVEQAYQALLLATAGQQK